MQLSIDQLFESSDQALVLIDRRQQMLLQANPAAMALLEWSPSTQFPLPVPPEVDSSPDNQALAFPSVKPFEAATANPASNHLARFFIPPTNGIALADGLELVQLVPKNQSIPDKDFSHPGKVVQNILDHTLDGIVVIDQDGLVVAFNKTAERMFGYTPQEVLGRNVSLLMPPPHREQHDGYIHAYLTTGVAKIIGKGREVEGLHKDGNRMPLLLRIGRECVVNGRSLFTGLLRDLSREKHVEAQLRQAQKMETIGTLAGGIAHDFNNILGGITGYVELMLEDADAGSDLQMDLGEMLKACDRAKSLVHQILTFSRRDQPQKKKLALDALLKESLKLMRATIPSTISIQRDIATDCPPILADATQVHQVILNLCTNAYHAMRKGGQLSVSLQKVTLDTNNHTIAEDLSYGDYVVLKMTDTGHGMDGPTLARIFDPFFTTKAVGEGTGMGLSVVHGIMRQHRGGIYALSELDHGSTFYAYFPALLEEGPDESETISPTQGGREHIILVDDDGLLLRVQTRMLQQQGYRVSPFTSPLEALERFRSNPADVDLVLTDQTMPGLTGYQLAMELLSLRPQLPIVLTTGYTDAVTPEDALDLGIRAFLTKPVKKADLCRTLRELLVDPQ